MHKFAIAGVLVSLTIGCSASSSMAPRSPASAMAGGSPAVAFGASASDVAAVPAPVRCSLEGEPRVVATHVAPRAGVKAISKGGQVWLHYATRAKADTTVALAPESLETVAGAVPPPAEMLDRPADSVAMDMEGGRRLVAWTQGSADSGKNVYATSVGADGSTDQPVDLGYQGSAIGDPAVAVTSAGDGVVAFIESNGKGFQLVATRVSCSR